MENKKLNYLIENNLVSEENYNKALEGQIEGETVLNTLIRLNFVNEKKVVEVLSQKSNYPIIDLNNIVIDNNVRSILSYEFITEENVLPLRLENNKLVIVVMDPFYYEVQQYIKLLTNLQLDIKLATETEIRKAIIAHYGKEYEQNSLIPELLRDKNIDEIKNQSLEDSPILQLIDNILESAVLNKASDIHFDPDEDKLYVRYRIDGDLTDHSILPKELQSMVESRLKIMSNLDITEKRLPQDGRIKLNLETNSVDIRVSTLPTNLGEKIVLRILDVANSISTIDDIGFNEKNMKIFSNLISRPNGIILVTGPTGSGKTTTLYSALAKLNKENINIITCEDPVEIEFPRINQISINETIGLTFSRSLRAILRQDPDIIMIGEMRDLETAEIAIKSSLTGHLVLSTLHTNDAVSSVYRLFDMGIKPYLIAASVTGIIAQRLVKTLCPDCKKLENVTKEEQHILKSKNIDVKKLYHKVGCTHCNNTGYRGRTAICEIFEITKEISDMIAKEATNNQLKTAAIKNGMESIFTDGINKVVEGITTIEEVIRVSDYE